MSITATRFTTRAYAAATKEHERRPGDDQHGRRPRRRGMLAELFELGDQGEGV
jgi:hypothetical protein